MGGSSSKTGVKRPVVLIIGGGYAGINVAKRLDKSGDFYVVLIDRKDYFFHNVAALRSVVENNFSPNILIPYSSLLSNGNGIVVQGEVTEISQTGVRVHGRDEPIQFDYLVIATGSSYAFPGKLGEPNRKDATIKYDAVHEAIKSANEITVVGGGTVGVELAGEIATDFPGKSVRLIHSHTEIVGSQYTDKFREKVTNQLKEKKIKLVLGERVLVDEGLKPHWNSTYVAGPRRVKTDKNSAGYQSDLVFFATGTVVNNRSLLTHFGDRIDSSTGRLKVNSHLQVEGLPNIFALGDIASAGSKQAFVAGLQAPILTDNLIALHNHKQKGDSRSSGGPKLKIWTAPRPAVFLSIGRDGGVCQLPTSGGALLGRRIARMMKSSGLFIERTWGDLNLKYKHALKKAENEENEEKGDVDEKKVLGLVEAMQLGEEDAKQLLQGLPAITERRAQAIS